MEAKPQSRIVSTETIVVTAMDNYDRHAAELSKAGATAEDLQPLRKAAEMVEQAEREEIIAKQQDTNLIEFTAPYTLANGWVIQPPTKAARRWALAAVTVATGGAGIETAFAQALAIVAALWVLQQWGLGNKAAVQKAVLSSSGLQDEIFDLVDEFTKSNEPGLLDRCASDYCHLMGMSKSALAALVKKNSQDRYEEALQLLRGRLIKTPG